MVSSSPFLSRTQRVPLGTTGPYLLLLLLTGLALSSCSRSGGGGGGGGSGDDDDSTSTSGDDDDAGDDDDNGNSIIGSSCEEEGVTDCVANLFLQCTDASWQLVDECVPPTAMCDPIEGCLHCAPGTTLCEDGNVVECDPDGLGTTLVEECEDGSTCSGGSCVNACTTSTQQFSYLGCNFLAVSAANPVLTSYSDAFLDDFAIVIGNPGGAGPAEVTVSRAGSVVTSTTVPEDETAAIQLSMVNEVALATTNVVVADGAFEVVSSVPVAAYQYNPLNFELGGNFSYTNDASLLLPEHVLTGNYRVTSLPSFSVGQSGMWGGFSPGFVTIAATQDGTSVTFDSTSVTADGDPSVIAAGGQVTVSLDRGDVVQILADNPTLGVDASFCTSNGGLLSSDDCGGLGTPGQCEYCLLVDADLTGSVVTATAPVAVIAGHQCTFIPYNEWACDHLEEMMFPLETWGTQVVMTAPTHPDGAGVTTARYRILAHQDSTSISTSPEVTASTTLSAGEWVEFDTDEDFVVTGTSPIYVAQFLHSQHSVGSEMGDPAMGSGVPWMQFRDSYDFLTPNTYTANYLSVFGPSGATIYLDGTEVSGWSTIGDTGFDVVRLPIEPGSHRIESITGSTFGITSYGYASYTSYLYPGGMNFIRGGG